MRDDAERVTEKDLVVPALRLAANQHDGFISTSDLIAELTEIFNPKGKDAEIISGRSDTYFSQKVRNLIAHKKRNFIVAGYAEHDEMRHGIIITQAGRELLDRLG